jgi:4-hydroxy-3-polyprenylbenzoate decarboxylase
MISPSGRQVLLQELQLDVDLANLEVRDFLARSQTATDALMHRNGTQSGSQGGIHQVADTEGIVSYFEHTDMMAPAASGSFPTVGMIICPCSGGTMSAVVRGASGNLIQRAADVHLKERRKLILVPRETPLSGIQLENMKRADDAGAIVLPAMPGWYHGVESLGDLIDFIVSRILDQLNIEHSLMQRWGSP